jgi:hypothetical protein
MRCDARQQQQQQSKMREREKERASVERERERERERGQSQRLDSGLNVVSAIRLAGNPKMPFCASLIDPLGRTGFCIVAKVAMIHTQEG